MFKKTILYTFNIKEKRLIKNGKVTVFHENGNFRLVSTKYGIALCGVIDIEQSVMLVLLAESNGNAKEKKAKFVDQLDNLLKSNVKNRIGSYVLARSKLDRMLDIAMQYKKDIPVQLTINDFFENQQTRRVSL